MVTGGRSGRAGCRRSSRRRRGRPRCTAWDLGALCRSPVSPETMTHRVAGGWPRRSPALGGDGERLGPRTCDAGGGGRRARAGPAERSSSSASCSRRPAAFGRVRRRPFLSSPPDVLGGGRPGRTGAELSHAPEAKARSRASPAQDVRIRCMSSGAPGAGVRPAGGTRAAGRGGWLSIFFWRFEYSITIVLVDIKRVCFS